MRETWCHVGCPEVGEEKAVGEEDSQERSERAGGNEHSGLDGSLPRKDGVRNGRTKAGAATSDSLSVSHSPCLIQSLSIALRPHPSDPSYPAIHSRCAVSEFFPQGIKMGPVLCIVHSLFFRSSQCNLRPIERETALEFGDPIGPGLPIPVRA